MARRRRSRSRQRRPRSRSRKQRAQASSDGSEGANAVGGAGEPYRLEILTSRDGPAMPMFDMSIEEERSGSNGEGGSQDASTAATAKHLIPHICANIGGGYAIRVTNATRRHIACSVAVDGENALLRDGSLIVAPMDSRTLPGFLVSKNFVGKEYVKEYRDFKFGKPKVIESSATGSTAPPAEEQAYTSYGRITCEVFEAVLDEEIDSDQELRGQTSFYRGAGLHGSFEDRLVPEGKKKHFLYSSVTVQGARSSIANSTRGRWWVRGQQQLSMLEVRYREAHSLMLLGVDPKALGLARCKEEDSKETGDGLAKKEEKDDLLAEKLDKLPGGQDAGFVDMCDLTAGGDEEAGAETTDAVWSVVPAPSKVEAVDM